MGSEMCIRDSLKTLQRFCLSSRMDSVLHHSLSMPQGVFRSGYFFRTAERGGSIGSKPFTGFAVNNRLRKHVSEAKLYAGETPHSFSVGLSNTLRLLGCSSEDVAHYLGKSGEVAKRYMQGSDTTVSLMLLEKVFPRATSGTVTPVLHPDNLQVAV